jgi:Zn ribbon nucleic-acid-binding protein
VETRTVECLSCGATREMALQSRPGESGECVRCGYLGWAEHETLNDTLRRLLRESPLQRRRLQPS